ncbi:50S ribosomal protein L25 [Inediibacterium massiliense]|uniref:50S ribosomal protein L25 n=1 Tax=Inediibacterium massiliense TaxID=1658111 RepID=UPI0006B517B3|nr:50S ribosomal protein L25 [Inediibacterium massiliense]
MLKASIQADLRSETGKGPSHRTRDAGYIPAIVYGPSRVTQPIEVGKMEINQIIRNYGMNVFLDLNMDTDRAVVMMKEVQRNPITNEIQHIDFQEISKNKPIQTIVPIRLIGRERAEANRGVVQQQLREVHVECLPTNIPESIAIDISSLAPGNPLKVADMEFSKEISILNQPQEIIASLTKAEKIEETEEDSSEAIE